MNRFQTFLLNSIFVFSTQSAFALDEHPRLGILYHTTENSSFQFDCQMLGKELHCDMTQSFIRAQVPKDKIDDDAVKSAIRSAQLEEFVASLPDGIETVVGERGVRLSGGQRQRIGIARALYNNPDVLVLDEATSSLDTETEHGVMQAVQALQGDKTVIIVAHRLSTVEYCDRLYRLENAHIVDEGTVSEVTSRTKDLPRDADQK